jgi:hypothetical protein
MAPHWERRVLAVRQARQRGMARPQIHLPQQGAGGGQRHARTTSDYIGCQLRTVVSTPERDLLRVLGEQW